MGDNEDMPETIDPTLSAAIEVARAAAVEAAGGEVGEHAGAVGDAELLASHQFAALEPGYRGWFWSVSITRAPDDDRVTVNDVVLLPGDEAVVAPSWTPYKERLRPGDLSPGDVLPPEDDDVRLVPSWSAGDGDEQTPDRYFAREVGLGRERVMSFEGREGAADRWQSGEFGPEAPIAQQAAGSCATCGFLISLAGDLSDRFGVCGNGQANADGRVVALSHGCGAHSGAKLKRSAAPQKLPPHVMDTLQSDELETLEVPAEVPTDEGVAEETPASDVQVDGAQADEPAAETASAEEAQADDIPVEEAPVEKSEADETPVDEAPVEESPVEDAPNPD